MNGKQLQKYIFDYIDQAPNKQVDALSMRLSNGQDGPFLSHLKGLGLVTAGTSNEDFLSLKNAINPAVNTLLHKGVVKHIHGTRGWALTNYSPDTRAFLSLPPKGRKATLKGLLTEAEWAVVEEAICLNKQSEPFTLSLRQKLFPTGTADGLLDYNAPTSISQNSHINDIWLTTLLGLGEWNNSANLLNEDVRVNLLRLTGHVDSIVQYPAIRYRVDAKGRVLPSDILALDGKLLITSDDMLQNYRKMFSVRQLLTGKLTPEIRELLENQRSAEIEAEEM